jgi:hypothetical protein
VSTARYRLISRIKQITFRLQKVKLFSYGIKVNMVEAKVMNENPKASFTNTEYGKLNSN